MSTPLSTKFLQLRMGVESGERQQDGVIVVDDIPVGAIVHARLDRPTELVTGALGDTQPYLFELAPWPSPFVAGGVTFGREAASRASAADPSSRQRVLFSSGNGLLTPEQHEPVWAAFAPAQTGSLRQEGKSVHALTMPGQTGTTPELPPADRSLLRMRWAATPVAAGVLGAVAAATSASGVWPSAHEALAPGSILLTLPTSGGVLRDTGKGRLVGPDGDGVVNYITGEWSATFRAAETGNLLVDYEHGCLYRPLDLNLMFDPLQAQ